MSLERKRVKSCGDGKGEDKKASRRKTSLGSLKSRMFSFLLNINPCVSHLDQSPQLLWKNAAEPKVLEKQDQPP